MDKVRKAGRDAGTWVVPDPAVTILKALFERPGQTVQELALALAGHPDFVRLRDDDDAVVVKIAINIGSLRSSTGDGPYVEGEWVSGTGYRYALTGAGLVIATPKPKPKPKPKRAKRTKGK